MAKKLSRRKERQRRTIYQVIHEGPKKSELSCIVENNLELKRILAKK